MHNLFFFYSWLKKNNSPASWAKHLRQSAFSLIVSKLFVKYLTNLYTSNFPNSTAITRREYTRNGQHRRWHPFKHTIVGDGQNMCPHLCFVCFLFISSFCHGTYSNAVIIILTKTLTFSHGLSLSYPTDHNFFYTVHIKTLPLCLSFFRCFSCIYICIYIILILCVHKQRQAFCVVRNTFSNITQES